MHPASSSLVSERLIEAQLKAVELFDTLEAQGFIHAGQSEQELSDRVFRLADERFGIQKHWHKRIVRTGPNTLLPYRENPPDRMIQPDDILFFDFGPIFEQFEADFGRTYVLGEDPRKHQLQADLLPLFEQGKAYYRGNPAMTGAELYRQVCRLAEDRGWQFGGSIAGHLVGQFPHERLIGDSAEHYIAPDNHLPMNQPDANGEPRHWILEIHLIDAERGFGGFYEDLLTLDRPGA